MGGSPLKALIEAKKIGLKLFLEIAVQLTDIQPKNIIVNLKTKKIELIDFSIYLRSGLLMESININVGASK